MSTREERMKRAKKIVKQKMEFIRHFVVYACVIAALAIINNLTWGGYQWWLWPALGWGIGVFSHFLATFMFQGGSLEQRMVDRELKRMEDEE
jgi:hypothetical protein